MYQRGLAVGVKNGWSLIAIEQRLSTAIKASTFRGLARSFQVILDPGEETMPTVRYMPPVVVVVAIGRLLSGRIRFSRDRVRQLLTMGDGEEHRVFREVRVTSNRAVPAESMTVLMVRFKFARFSPAANRRLSLLPIPVILGMPGFRQKTWTLCEDSGFSQGIYQFESPGAADGYRRSPVMRVLEKRSVPGSMTHEVIPGVLIEDYLEQYLESSLP
jgi:hypothetical protein